jgi:predicted nucleic acid-binding protein
VALDFEDGVIVFLDANILAYAVVEEKDFTAPCQDLLRRVETGRISAWSASFAVADALHKVMLAEARLRLPDEVNVGRYLQRHPETVRSLVFARAAAAQFAQLPLQLLPLGAHSLVDAMDVSRQHGLLTNDALIVALMERHGLVHLATNDDDFDRVPGITVWKPRA